MGIDIDETYEEIQIYKKYGVEGFMCPNKEKEPVKKIMNIKGKDFGGPGDWVHDHGFVDLSRGFGLSQYKILWDVHRSVLYLDRGDHKEKIDLDQQVGLQYEDGMSKMRGNWLDDRFLIPWIEENIKEV